ncbi:MAG: OmpH family outer membrane protein, partial [Tabrizicola sp.]|nr:OmpH family outer membrane protein [Tabrizicola sp.]
MALVATVALGLWHSPVPAQEVSSKVVGSAVLVVDQGRLFAESDFGRASIAREEKAARELEAENIRIQAELVAEEQELTFQRQSLPAEEFSARAEAFDQKVERIRAEQD